MDEYSTPVLARGREKLLAIGYQLSAFSQRSGKRQMFGTICHFDYGPRAISDDSIALMEAVAPLLKRDLGRIRRPK
jgi:hypothetical protein